MALLLALRWPEWTTVPQSPELESRILTECSRERAKEMTVFALVALTSAWPVVYMIITVVKLLSKGRP